MPHDDGDYEEPVSVPTGPGRRGSVDYQTTMNGSMYGGHQESREEDELSEDQESVARFNTKQTGKEDYMREITCINLWLKQHSKHMSFARGRLMQQRLKASPALLLCTLPC